jgi:aminoglycoside phosphotransferase (APT) family kinase protein
MSIKKISIILSVLGCVVIFSFFFGYHIGQKNGTLSALPPMLDMQRFFIADRLATVVSDLHRIKSNQGLNQKSICDMKKIVLNQVDDWNACKKINPAMKKLVQDFMPRQMRK